MFPLFAGRMPAKVILTGVVLFAVPILLTQQKYAPRGHRADHPAVLGRHPDQHAVRCALRRPDRTIDRCALRRGDVQRFWPARLIGLIGRTTLTRLTQPFVVTIVLIVGMLILGIGHGIIGAPLITHVTNTPAAQVLGPTSAASVYRFFERFGNVGFGRCWRPRSWR